MYDDCGEGDEVANDDDRDETDTVIFGIICLSSVTYIYVHIHLHMSFE